MAFNNMNHNPSLDINLEGGESLETPAQQCSSSSERTRKAAIGVVLTTLIAWCWVGTLHLIKLSFNLGQQRYTFYPGLSNGTQSNANFSAAQTTSSPDQSISTTEMTHPKGKEAVEYVFDAPFFTTWYYSMWNALFLPIYLIGRQFWCNHDKAAAKVLFIENIQQFIEKGFTTLQFFGRCAFFSILWMMTNFTLIYSLRLLDTTVVMSLFSCTVTIIYLLSWVVLHQQFVGIRIVAIIICDTGIALLAYMDGVTKRRTVAGVVIGFGAALGSAVYKVFYKRMIGYTTPAQMSMFFTLIAILNTFFMWPIVLLLYFTGAETIIWSRIPWLPLSGAALLNLTANVLGNFGVMWTYEVFLILGLLFAIPISSVIDATFYQVEFKEMKLAGILLILFGFLVVLLPDNWNEYFGDILREKLAKWKRKEQMKKNGRVQDTSTGHLSRLRTPSGRVK